MFRMKEWNESVGKQREDSGCSHAVEEASASQVIEFPIKKICSLAYVEAESVAVGWLEVYTEKREQMQTYSKHDLCFFVYL